MNTRDEAYEKSIELLHSLGTKDGFLASKENVENYERVWARDGVVAGIASLLVGDEKLIKTFEKTLDTLRVHQDETGRIPSNVTPETGATSYGTTVGRVDATLWYIIGVIALTKLANAHTFFSRHRASVEKALFYLSCLELNGRGLLYIPQGGDWADEYINHGYVLFDEMLYYFALTAYGTLTGNKKALESRDLLANLIRVNYFPNESNRNSDFVYHRALYDYAINMDRPPIPASYFTNHSIRFQVDTFAISLLLSSDILNASERSNISDYVRKSCQHDGFPILPAFHPIITEKDCEWRHLKLDFLYEFRNKKNEYHNGGLWPLVHGFFISAQPKEQQTAIQELDAFAETLARDGYIFPEFYHGTTFEALGTKKLGFSASAYLIAYESIMHKKMLFEALSENKSV